MTSMATNQQKQQNGFALLMTLIVVGVVLSVGLSLLDLSIKQVRLATNAKDSEIAFHAANAGVECARYIRRIKAPWIVGGKDESGNDVGPGDPLGDISCFDVPNGSSDRIDKSDLVVSGEVYQYKYKFSWGQKCAAVNMVAAITDGSDLTIDATDMQTLIPRYNDDDLECIAGSLCTVVSVQGYNKPCNAINNYGTVQREVLLKF